VSTDSRNQGETLLNVATSLLQNDSKSAVTFARASLKYPASVALSQFLFQLWATDQQAAGKFYQQALNVYVNAPVNELLYLSPYPFGLNRVVGPEMQSTFFKVPTNFVADSAAQNSFLEVILRRGQETTERSTQPVSGPARLPEMVQIYLALSSLRSLTTRDQVYAERVAGLQATLEPLLSAEAQQDTANILQQQQDLNISVDTLVERIERERVPELKDRLIARVVLAAKSVAELEQVESLSEKVSDSKFRNELLDWVYFKRAQKLISVGRLDEAAQLIAKVEQVDHRAYLAFLLASESTRKIKDSVLAIQVLEDVAKTALQVPNTIEKARTLLGLTSTYAKFDRPRAFEILEAAINVVSKINEPDLTSTAIFRRIGTSRFTMHAAYEIRGSSLDTVFREFAPDDFVKSLWLANQLPDKPLRAAGTFAISGRCLEIAKQKEPAAKPKASFE
jgi:tetratricopeptide (TPR) repeat protein